MLAHDVAIDPATGDVRWGKPLPVVFRPCVTSEVDPARLQEVLEYNANDPRRAGRPKASSPKPKAGKKA